VVTVGNPPSVHITANQAFCDGATISDLEVEGFGIKWYMDADLLLPLSIDYVMVDGERYYAVNTGEHCVSDTASIKVTIYPIPDPPVFDPNEKAELCDGEVIDIDFLEGLLDKQPNTDYRFYHDAAATNQFTTSITTNHSTATSHTFYAMAYYEGTECTHDIDSALLMLITVNPRPLAPIDLVALDHSVCDGDTIFLALLESLIDYDNTTVTAEFYTNAACTVPFDFIATDHDVASSHTIYVIARNIVTGCATSSTNALQLVIIVNPLATAPVLKLDADTSVCDGELINIAYLEDLLDYDPLITTLEFFNDSGCTDPFIDIPTDYATATYHEIYVRSRNLATDCAAASDAILKLTILVDSLPNAPTISATDLSVCDETLIDEKTLLDLLDYNDQEVTV
jgi:hypothetical protein